MQTDPLFFFVSEHPKEKIRRVGGKQAEPGVASGFEFIERPLNFESVCAIFKIKAGSG